MGERELAVLQRGEAEPVEVASLCTQTEWSWLEDMRVQENLQQEVATKEHTRRLSQGSVTSQGSKPGRRSRSSSHASGSADPRKKEGAGSAEGRRVSKADPRKK